MEERLQTLHSEVFDMYRNMVQTLNWAKAQLNQHERDKEYCVDVAFAMRELDKLIHDIGVETRKVFERAQSYACKEWLMGDDAQPIRTPYVTATPDIKLQPKMPRKDTPEMTALLDWLGVKRNHDAVRIHWPTLCDVITERVSEGKKLPECIDPGNLHNPTAVLRFHKKKDVTDDVNS